MVPVFTVDLEDWNHALHVADNGYSSVESVRFLFDKLNEYGVKAEVYILGRFQEEHPEIMDMIKLHDWGSHGYFHDHDESITPDILYYTYSFRSPYWDTTPMPWPPSGGFFFRFMPLWYVKWAVKKSGVFWIHPHDLDENHPRVKNWWLNWKRHIGLKQSRLKLERLLKEIEWAGASQLQKS